MTERPFAHRPEIDGLRAVAVLPVIAYHAGFPGLPGGFLGVDIFFVVSGYLITGILLADMHNGRFSLARFYERRARRILPALVVTLLLCIPFAIWLMLPGQLVDFGKGLVSVVAFVSNVYFWRKTDYFAEAAELQPLLHTWSLAVEEQFYLFFPLFLLVIWRVGRRADLVALALLVLFSFALSVWASHNSPVANFYLLPTRAWELLAGSLCTLATMRGRLETNGTLSALGLGLILVAVVRLDASSALPGVGTLLPVAGTCLIILFSREAKDPVGRLLSTRPFVGIGLISYSAYLFHQPLYAFARLGWPEALGPWLLTVLGAVSLALAALSWRYVEQPFRRPGTPLLRGRSAVFAASFATSLAIVGIGMGVVLSQGLAFRYAPADRALALFDRSAAGDYVRKRFDAAQLRPFEDNGLPKLLVIGDSFGQDFVNVLHEGGLAAGLDISTHFISRRCGNLLVDDDLSAFVARSDKALCERAGGMDRAELPPLLREANIVLLASDWRPWQLEHVAATVANLRTMTDAEIFVLGRKDFGPVHLRSYLRQTSADRIAARKPTSEYQIRVNRLLSASLGDAFIDLHALICGSENACPLFTEEGELISYDGTHLTRAGAIWLSGLAREHLPFP